MTEQFEDRLMADAANLATEIAPERELWPNIEAEIRRPAPKAGLPWYAQVAAVVALVGASSLITYTLTKSDVRSTQIIPVVTSPAFDAEFASFGQELMLPASYESDRIGLAAELDMALDELSPEVRVVVEENLELIRDAVDEISAALEQEPNSEHLQEMLADAYRKELAVMRQVGGLTRSVTSRNDI